SPDELTVVFASTRAGGPGSADIYIATRTSKTAAFGAPSLVAGVNTAGRESRPILSTDGLSLYAEYQPNPNSTWDIVKSTRASAAAQFSTPLSITSIDTTSNEVAPYVLPDNNT